MIRMLAIVLTLLALPRAAAAQGGTLELSGGYSFVNDPENHVHLPAGWMASAGVGLTGWLSIVADVSGNYKTISAFGSDLRISAHAAMAGVRASGRIGKLTEFGQLLAGVVRGSGSAFGFTDTTNTFSLQPGVGVDVPLREALALRGQLDVRFIHSQPAGNNAGYEYRVVGALVYTMRRSIVVSVPRR